MIFLHATTIAGLAAVILPLLIQRLGRTRIKSVEWGAMMFLNDASERASLSVRRREWTLLAVRMLIIVALALGLAEPVSSEAFAAQGAGLTVIILDRSGSMSVDTGGKSRLDLARRAALNVLAALPGGDEAAVIFSPEAFGSTVTTDFQQVAARISDVRQSGNRADLPSALNTAARLLSSSHAGRRNLFLIGDRQASSYRDMNDAFVKTWRGQLASFPVPTLRFVAVGTPVANAAVLSADVIDSQLAAGKPFELEIKLANYADSIANEVAVSILANDQVIDQSTVPLPAKATTSIRRTIRLTTTGSQILTIRINEDSMALDDSVDIAAYVPSAQNALRVTPEQNLSIGDPIIADLPISSGERVTIEGPGGGGVDVAPMPQGVQARFSATARPGIYRLHYPTAAGQQTLHFVVRAPRDESDLTDLPPPALTRLLTSLDFAPLSEPTAEAINRELNPVRLESWVPLLSAAVALTILDAALSRFWLRPLRGAAA